MMWLVKFTDNWADEMDIEGFKTLSNSTFMQWARLVEDVAAAIDNGHEFEWYIGTNESIVYSTGRDFKNCFECEVIEDSYAEFLKETFIKSYDAYGHFPNDEVLLNLLEYVKETK